MINTKAAAVQTEPMIAPAFLINPLGLPTNSHCHTTIADHLPAQHSRAIGTLPQRFENFQWPEVTFGCGPACNLNFDGKEISSAARVKNSTLLTGLIVRPLTRIDPTVHSGRA